MTRKNSSIVIVGGGAFGLSTALHLVEHGYNNITVLEQGEQIPAGQSAANDLNKIVRAEYEDPFYTDLAIVRVISLPIYEFPVNKCLLESNRRLENTAFRTAFPSDRFPTLRLRRCTPQGH